MNECDGGVCFVFLLLFTVDGVPSGWFQGIHQSGWLLSYNCKTFLGWRQRTWYSFKVGVVAADEQFSSRVLLHFDAQ